MLLLDACFLSRSVIGSTSSSVRPATDMAVSRSQSYIETDSVRELVFLLQIVALILV
jgi:hypothetical protein